MPKYSIITPNYNGFALMKNYFESLEAQTMKDFEVIIVDDCSKDDSYLQLQNYAKASEMNIRVYQSEQNSGPGNARNIGMDKATGDFITFIDNDDWVEVTWLEQIDKVLADNPDINCVIYDYYIKSETSQSVSHSMYKGKGGIISLSDCMVFARNHTVGKFYKLSDCRREQIRFPELRRCEDVAFVCRAIEACKTVYYLNIPLYYYYQRPTSLSNNKKMDESDMVKAFAIIEEHLALKYPQEIKEKSVTDLLYGGLLMMLKAGKSRRYILDYLKKYENKYPEWWKCNILHSIGRAKFVYLQCARFRFILMLKTLTYLHSRLVDK